MGGLSQRVTSEYDPNRRLFHRLFRSPAGAPAGVWFRLYLSFS